MTYSSALFEDGSSDLTAAQNNKYRRLAEAIDLRPGQKLLEIGCGWGGFAEYAARTYGTRVVGLTISKEQRDFAQARIQKAGLNDLVEIRLQDYRDERDRYDRIASIEMIEAVGEQFWPNYFSQLRDRLLPGGLAGIQAITIQDSLFKTYRRDVDFIQRYVFPGGMLPSPQILKSLGERFGVPVIRERIFGQDYARTLAIWRSNFRAAWPQPDAIGFRRPLPPVVGILPRLLRGGISCPEISTCGRWCSPNPTDGLRLTAVPFAGLYAPRRSFRVAQRLGNQTGIFRHDLQQGRRPGDRQHAADQTQARI